MIIKMDAKKIEMFKIITAIVAGVAVLYTGISFFFRIFKAWNNWEPFALNATAVITIILVSLLTAASMGLLCFHTFTRYGKSSAIEKKGNLFGFALAAFTAGQGIIALTTFARPHFARIVYAIEYRSSPFSNLGEFFRVGFFFRVTVPIIAALLICIIFAILTLDSFGKLDNMKIMAKTLPKLKPKLKFLPAIAGGIALISAGLQFIYSFIESIRYSSIGLFSIQPTFDLIFFIPFILFYLFCPKDYAKEP